MKMDRKNLALFAGGVLFGTAGIKMLSSKDAKKAYVCATAAILRAKESVMDTVTKIQENAEDVLAQAKLENQEREEREKLLLMEDTAEEIQEDGDEAECSQQ